MIKTANIEFIMGRAGTGKTRKLVNMAFNEALKGNYVYMVSDELDKDEFNTQIIQLLLDRLNLELGELTSLETCSEMQQAISKRIFFGAKLDEVYAGQCSLILIDNQEVEGEYLMKLRKKFLTAHIAVAKTINN